MLCTLRVPPLFKHPQNYQFRHFCIPTQSFNDTLHLSLDPGIISDRKFMCMHSTHLKWPDWPCMWAYIKLFVISFSFSFFINFRASFDISSWTIACFHPITLDINKNKVTLKPWFGMQSFEIGSLGVFEKEEVVWRYKA